MPGFRHSPLDDIQRIRQDLRDRYQDGFPILKELLQNADDAGASEPSGAASQLVLVLVRDGLKGAQHPLLRSAGLMVLNDGAFAANDAISITSLGMSNKAGQVGAAGKFGLGLKSIFHWAEAFFYFSPHSLPGSGPNRAEPFGLLNPWWNRETFDGRHRGWEEAWEQSRDADLQAFAQLAARTLAGSRWFGLWIPLRRPEHLWDGEQEIKPIEQRFPGARFDELLGEAWESRLAETMPLLRRLRTVCLLKLNSDVLEVRATLDVSDGARRMRFGTNGSIEGSPFREVVSGSILTGNDEGAQCHFVGMEQLGDGASPLELKRHPNWPSQTGIGLDGGDVQVPEKGEPHAAVVFTRQPGYGGGSLRLQPAVFLPLGEPEETALRGDWQYCLYLHGFFFVDSGRRHIQSFEHLPAGLAADQAATELQVIKLWNRTLMREVVAPLILPSLHAFVQQGELSAEEVGWMVGALRKSNLLNPLLPWICRGQRFLYRLQPDGGRWVHESWDAQGANPVRWIALPKPEFPAHEVFQLLPALTPLCSQAVVSILDTPYLADGKPELVGKADSELAVLLVSVPAMAFANAKYLDYLLKLIPDEVPEREPRSELVEALVQLASRVLGQRLPEDRELAYRWKELFKRLPGRAFVRLPIRSADVDHGLRRELSDAAPPVAILWQDWQESGGRGVIPWTDLMPVLRGLGRLTLGGEQAVNQRSEVAVRLLEACKDAPEAWPEDIDCLPLFVSSSGGARTAETSFADLRRADRDGRLFTGGDAWAGDLAKAAPDAKPVLIEASLAEVLGFGTKACDAVACAVLLKAAGRVVPDFARRKPLFDRFLASAASQERGNWAAMRCLLHGHGDQWEGRAALFREAQRTDAFVKLVRLALGAATQSWRVIPAHVGSQLRVDDSHRMGLTLVEVSAETTEVLVREIGPDRVDCVTLSNEEADDILLQFTDVEVLSGLKIHETLDERRVGIDPHTYVDDGTFTELPDAFDAVVTRIRHRTAYGRPEFQNPDGANRLVKNLTWEAVVEVGLDQPIPEACWEPILTAIGRLGSLRSELRDRVRHIAWLPLAGGKSIRPADVLHLPGADAQVDWLPAEVLGGKAPTLRLAEDVRNHPRFATFRGAVLLPAKEALEALAILLQPHSAWSTGLTDDWTAEQVSEWVAALSDAPGQALPVATLVKAIYEQEGLRELLPEFLRRVSGRIAPAPYAGVLNHLITAHQAGQSDVQERVLRVVIRYLAAIAEGGLDLTRHLLSSAGVKLVSKAGIARESGLLAFPDGSLHPEDQLHEGLSPALSCLRPNHPQIVELDAVDETPALQPENPVPALREYFAPWRIHLNPTDAVGALLVVLGIRAQALSKEFFSTWSREQVMAVLEQADMAAAGLGSLHDRIQRRSFRILTVPEPHARVRSILGNDFMARLADQPNTLLIPVDGQQVAVLQDGGRISCRLQFRKLDLESGNYTAEQLIGLLRETTAVVLSHALRAKADVRPLFEKLSRATQLQVTIAQNMIVDQALAFLRQVGAQSQLDLRSALAKWDDARREEALAEANGQSPDRALSMRRQARDAIRKLLAEEPTVQAVVLAGVKRKLAEFQYAPSSTPFELWQNADDAVTELARLGLDADLPSDLGFVVLQLDGALVFVHWGRLINEFVGLDGTNRRDAGFDRDLEKMLVPATSDKADISAQGGVALTGKFGLGFKSVFLASDSPAVVSGGVDFVICGGIYPVRLVPQQREALITELKSLSPEHWRRGTIIRLPMPVDGEQTPDKALGLFHRLAPLLVVFSRKLRRLRLVRDGVGEVEFRWQPESISDGIKVGALQGFAGEVSHALVFDALTGNDRLQFLLGLSPDGFANLPQDVPTFWVTAPTRTTPDYGFAANGPFEPDVGRIQLALKSPRNDQLVYELAGFLSKRLEALWRLAQGDWPALRGILRLASGTTAFAFWESLWKVLGRRFADRCPASDNNPVAGLARRILWGSDDIGLRRFYSVCPTLPTGLWGAHSTLTRLTDIRFEAAGALDREDVFCAASQWPAFQVRVRAAQMVSEAQVANVLRRLDALADRLDLVHLVTVIEWELAQGQELRAGQETSSRLGHLVTPEFLKALKEGNTSQREEREHKALSELLPKVFVQAAEGSWHRSAELVVAEGDGVDVDERMRAAFAPPDCRLNSAYTGPALEFFLACRPELSAVAETMVGWVLQAADDRSRIAALRYLLDGKLKDKVAEGVRCRIDDQNWLWQVARGPQNFAWFGRTFSEEDLHQLQAYILRIFDQELRGLSGPPPSLPPPPPPRPTWSVRQLWLWWEQQGKPVDDYVLEGKANWPLFHGGPIPDEEHRQTELRRLLLSPSSSEGKSVWYRLFGYACLVSAGRTVTEMRRFWLQRLEPTGFWTRTTAGDFSDGTREIFKQAVTAEFKNLDAGGEQAYFWRRVFYDIRKVHRMVQNEFPLVLLDLVHQGHGEHLRQFLRTGHLPGPNQPRWIGTFGQSADTPLGFIIRELYRLEVITDKSVLPYAFHICRPVVRALEKIGWISDLDGWFNGERWLRNLDEDASCGPKLLPYFDIPLLHMGITHRGDKMPNLPNEP